MTIVELSFILTIVESLHRAMKKYFGHILTQTKKRKTSIPGPSPNPNCNTMPWPSGLLTNFTIVIMSSWCNLSNGDMEMSSLQGQAKAPLYNS